LRAFLGPEFKAIKKKKKKKLRRLQGLLTKKDTHCI
jgi:hypothetical protein